MTQLYLVRHGKADYDLNKLKAEGVSQVHSIGCILEQRLPARTTGLTVTSPSRRVRETYAILEPYLKKRLDFVKVGDVVRSFRELYTSRIFLDSSALMRGRANVQRIEEYAQEADVIIITSHKRLIGATIHGLAEKYEIQLPPNLAITENAEDFLGRFLKKSKDGNSEKIRETILNNGTGKMLPHIGEANAVFVDLDKKVTELISLN